MKHTYIFRLGKEHQDQAMKDEFGTFKGSLVGKPELVKTKEGTWIARVTVREVE